MSLDSDIDRLYQLPLNEFTAARIALAKTAAGRAGEVRTLAKPSLPAWAVNQLYFEDRATYDRLIEAATELRRAHKAILEGKKADLRDADNAHDQAVDTALRKTLAILEKFGHPVTAATRDAVSRTLHALPAAGVAHGRLTKPLKPGGFDMLTGITPRAGRVVAFPPQKPSGSQRPPATAQKGSRGNADAVRAERAARQRAVAAAKRALEDARRNESHARREAALAEARVERARADAARKRDAWQDAERERVRLQEEAEKLRRDVARAADELDEARRAAARFK